MFNINLLVLNSWFYLYTLVIRYNSIFYKNYLVDINTFDYNKKIILKNKKKINLNCVIYYFFLNYYNFKLNIVTFSSTLRSLESLNYLFPNSLWIERELSEMFNISFKNSIDNRILLLDYSFVGNPLLKIFPVIGNLEIYYNFLKGWVSYTNLLNKESLKIDFNY